MAAAYRSIASNTAAAGTVVVTKPSGLTAGDMMVALCSQVNSSGSWNTPSGWTDMGSVQTPGDLDVRVFAKVASSGDAAASDFTFVYSASSKVEAILYAVSGTFASTANIYAISVVAATEAATDVLRGATGIIPSAAGSLLIMFIYGSFTDSDNNAISNYAIQTDNPTWTEHAEIQDNGGTNTVRIGTATATRTEVTDTGYFQADVSTGAVGANGSVGVLLAINDTANASPSLSPVTAAFTVPGVSPTGDANVTAPAVISFTASVPSVTPVTGQPDWVNDDKPAVSDISNTDKP